MIMMAPTADPELNGVLRELVTSLQAILQDHFLAAYLHGSFALGDWDVHSDVDFLVRLDHDRSLLDHIALMQDLEDFFGCRVDVVTERALHRLIRDRVLAEAVPL